MGARLAITAAAAEPDRWQSTFITSHRKAIEYSIDPTHNVHRTKNQESEENMNKNRVWLYILALCLAGMSCTCPLFTATQGATPTAVAGSIQSNTELTPGTAPETAAPVVAPPTSCTSTVVANTPINVRKGPGTVYDTIGSLPAGGSALVAGKNDDSTWWYIEFAGGAGGYAWVSASVVTASCISSTLAIIAAPPTPLPASGTCKAGYVYRLARPSDKVCVLPASQAQAAADNAAAGSRKVENIYGPDQCISGYVWRDAFSGDHVCVTPGVRSQAAADNAAAASRWTSGAYGPHTCIMGYVWREAGSGDDVCVTPDIRSQAAADNAAADSRKAFAYGMDTCISGYVWRDAFSGDHVCVTPDIRSQAAADNAAAPSHTWP